MYAALVSASSFNYYFEGVINTGIFSSLTSIMAFYYGQVALTSYPGGCGLSYNIKLYPNFAYTATG